MATTIAALILAGGDASRMGGGDKTLRSLGGQPILGHILRRLRADHPAIAISANGDPARFASFGLPVLADKQRVGPLGGILAGLRWARAAMADHLLTVPGDSPFLPRHLAASLSPPPSMAMSAGRRHPTVSLWPTASADALEAHLERLDPADHRDFSVVAFACVIGMRTVTFDDAAGDPFFNVNTPDDLAHAEHRLGC